MSRVAQCFVTSTAVLSCIKNKQKKGSLKARAASAPEALPAVPRLAQSASSLGKSKK